MSASTRAELDRIAFEVIHDIEGLAPQGFARTGLEDAAYRLAVAYRDEHPADDDAAVTVDALVAMGGSIREEGVDRSVLFGKWSYGLFFWVPDGHFVCRCTLESGDDCIDVPTPKTVGDARRLLKALSLFPERSRV